MPFTPWSFKRLVLLAGRGARAFAALAKLTPARADMMISMLSRELTQKGLVEALGICASVVSRMVRALERLGLVARRTPAEDRRVRWVSLTAAGRKALDVFFDGWMPSDGTCTVQARAEHEVLEDWRDTLIPIGLYFLMPYLDAGPVLRRIRNAHGEVDYWAEDFGVEEARKMRRERNSAMRERAR